MSGFWKRQQSTDLENALRRGRPVPRNAFVAAVARSIDDTPRLSRMRRWRGDLGDRVRVGRLRVLDLVEVERLHGGRAPEPDRADPTPRLVEPCAVRACPRAAAPEAEAHSASAASSSSTAGAADRIRYQRIRAAGDREQRLVRSATGELWNRRRDHSPDERKSQ